MQENDQGQTQEPTPEEILAEKKKRFEENPDNFIDKRFIVAASYFDLNAGCVVTSIHQKTPNADLNKAFAELNFFIQSEMARRVMSSQAKKFQPNTGGIGGIKKKLFNKKKRF